MADPLQKLEQQLTCAVCLQLYTNPKALPCQHNFCQDCLNSCPRDLREDNYFVNCPTCRMPARIPDGGVPAFPPAFTINSLFELHQDMLARKDAMDCPYHNRSLEAFCTDCLELVCFCCATRSHSGHRVQMIADIIDNCKVQLEQGTQPVKQQIAVVKDAIKSLDSCDEAIARQAEAIEKLIRSQANEVRIAVGQAETRLIQDVRIAVQRKRAVFALQRQEAQEELARLKSSIEFVQQSIKVQFDQQIVASMSKLLECLKASVSRAKDAKIQPVERIDLIYERNPKAIEECNNLGRLHYSHLSQTCQLALQSVAPGRNACFELSARESNGSLFSISTSLISCLLTASSGPQPMDFILTQTGPGTWDIRYTPVVRGPQHLRVTVGGVDIPGSPFSIPVLPPSPTTRDQPLHTMQGLKRPSYVAVSSRGQVVVSETGADCITIFNSELRQIISVGSRGKGPHHFSGPAGIVITNDDRILVVDRNNNRIQVLTTEGQFLVSVGTRDCGPVQLDSPMSIVIHPNGQVLVSERNSNRIHVLNHDLTFSHSFPTRGSPRGQGVGHYDMAVDSQGAVYATHPLDGCIRKFYISGQFVGQFGIRGYDKGQLALPYGIAIDDKDNVYISEGSNQRISIFTSSGEFVHCFRAHGNHGGSVREEKCIGLHGLAFDKNGNLYTCFTRDGQVVIF